MKKILLASAALAALSTASLAADLPSSKGPPPAPVYVPIFTWTGFYVGLQGGYQWGRSSGTHFAPIGVPFSTYGYDPKGGVFGGHVGYNYQISPNFVVGLEGDIEWSGMRATGLDSAAALLERTKIDWQGSLRGRVGVAFDRALIYATGGVAFADIHHTVTPLAGPPSVLSYSDTKAGWTLGAGIEYALTNNFTIRGEYRYADYGRVSGSNAATNVASNSKVTTHTVRAGVSYKF